MIQALLALTVLVMVGVYLFQAASEQDVDATVEGQAEAPIAAGSVKGQEGQGTREAVATHSEMPTSTSVPPSPAPTSTSALVPIATPTARPNLTITNSFSELRCKGPAQLTNLAEDYLDKGEYDNVIEVTTEFIRCYQEHEFYDPEYALDPQLPRKALAHLNRGSAYHFFGRYEQALEDFNEHLRRYPSSYHGRSKRGMTYYYLGQYERAIEDLSEAIRNDREDPRWPFGFRGNSELFLHRGDSHSGLGQHDRAIEDYNEAIRMYSEAIRLDPRDSNSYVDRGLSYSRLSQNDRAIQDYDEAIRLNPDSPKTYIYRAGAYYDLGQYDRAIQDYDEAIRLDPNDETTANNRSLACSMLAAAQKSQFGC
tara:strand:+ start:270 stop:1370 length:1101 start_codon:yes stop_codon:yes gene_type:complete